VARRVPRGDARSEPSVVGAAANFTKGIEAKALTSCKRAEEHSWDKV